MSDKPMTFEEALRQLCIELRLVREWGGKDGENFVRPEVDDVRAAHAREVAEAEARVWREALDYHFGWCKRCPDPVAACAEGRMYHKSAADAERRAKEGR